MEKRKFDKGIQRNKVTITLDNGELNYFEGLILSKCLNKDMREHIISQINKTRRIN